MILLDIVDNIKSAVVYGRTDILRSILDACDSGRLSGEVSKDKLLNTKLIPEGTFLSLAVQLNQVDIVRSLLNSGADPNVGEVYARAVSNEVIRQLFVEELIRASANGSIRRIQQLLEAGMNVNSYDSESSLNTPLHYAASYASADTVSFLIGRGANVNATNSCGAIPLHDAIHRGDSEIVAILLDHGSDVHIVPKLGKFANQNGLSLSKSHPEIHSLIASRLCEESNELNKQEVNHLLNESGPRSDDSSTQQQQFDLQIFQSSVDYSVEKPAGRRRHVSESAGVSSKGIEPTSRSASAVGVSIGSSLDLVPKLDEVMGKLGHKSGARANTVTHPSLHLLWPQPRKIREFPGQGFTHQKELLISVLQGSISVHKILDVWEVSRPYLVALGFSVKINDVQSTTGKYPSAPIECAVNSSLFQTDDAYQIHIASNKIQLSAGSLRGLHYSITTLVQLFRLFPDSDLPSMQIQDRSSLKHRGILLDFSPRGRIPSLEFLFSLLDLLSTLKINYVHLYTRLLPSCDWQLCYSKSEMIAIDRRAQDRFITLVPVLDVDDSVSEAVDGMWTTLHEFLICFPNLEFIHIGPRLTVLLTHSKDLLEDLTSTTCCSEVSGNADEPCGRNLLSRLCATSATVMLCANSLRSMPKPNFPRNLVLVEYGFQADYDFFEKIQELQQDGEILGFCPGTAAWNSLAGCPEAALCNISSAVQCCAEESGLGVVVAHWSGSYHLTPHTFAYPGFMLAAGLTWNKDTHWDNLQTSLAELLDAHVLFDSIGVAGRTLLELGRIETHVLKATRPQSSSDMTNLPDPEGSTLYKLLTDPDSVSLEHLTIDLFNRATKHIKKQQKELLKTKLSCPFSEMIVQEALLSADLMLTACRIGRALLTVGVNPNSNMGLPAINLGVNNLPPTFRTDIANKLLAHMEQYKGTWLQRHLPGGLQTSLLIFTSALQRFVPSNPDD